MGYSSFRTVKIPHQNLLVHLGATNLAPKPVLGHLGATDLTTKIACVYFG